MLDNLKYEDYAEQINTKFHLPEIGIEIELIEVLQKNAIPGQEMFSLLFLGSKENFLEQRIYQMNHENLGDGSLFLVPIALDADGYKYEAGFNRLIDQK